MLKNLLYVCGILGCSSILFASVREGETALKKEGYTVIPYPQSVVIGGPAYDFESGVNITVDKKAPEEELFTARELSAQLREQWGIESTITPGIEKKGIALTLKNAPKELGDQGYLINASASGLIIQANTSAGLFYGTQTLLQLIRKKNGKYFVKGMVLKDWPDIPIRAIHYDTKHFQEKKDYVFHFIRTLASYKINMLIWEWEDKFAYKSHPEIGAPGAFTMEEMQEFTRYARKYHIQLIPLIQGLGHVSFILKHPQNIPLREIESNNWGFCPLRDGTYTLMSDLIKEAIEATPGSGYVHIGCDETYVLGEGISCGCKEKAEKDGKFALMEIYVNRVAGMVKEQHRQPMAWDGGYNPDERVKPVQGLFTPGGFDARIDKAALEKGFPLYVYDPNPGIEHLFLPYFYRENEKGPVQPHLEESYGVMTKASRSGKYKGMISTSWNCSGVHNQIWMLRYITAAEYSWNGKQPALDEFKESFFLNYYGPQSKDVNEIYLLLNKAAYYYMSTFERKVWHWGEVGKTHLPDLPRDDMEFDPFWNTEYAGMINRSREVLPQMERVLTLCDENLRNGVKNSYDFELFRGLAKLFRHTANTYLSMSALEKSIEQAAGTHFDNSQATYNELLHACDIIKENIDERNQVFAEIKTTWEKSQFPKGMSLPGKSYVHARDEQHNFANRRPDLSFMICDEESLGLEEYLTELQKYMLFYKNKYLQPNP
jgi:hexosaminidase